MEKIDYEKWDRKEIFEHFYHVAKSTYSITVKINVTKVLQFVEKSNMKFYSVMTWIVSKAINEHKQFKMGYDQEGNLGFYEVVHPQFPVMDFNYNVVSLMTDYDENIERFNDKMNEVINSFEKEGVVPEIKENMIMISTLPWIHYESFSVNNESGLHFLFPMVTWGEYELDHGTYRMPLTIQISHAAADGYHCHLFFESVEKIVDSLLSKMKGQCYHAEIHSDKYLSIEAQGDGFQG